MLFHRRFVFPLLLAFRSSSGVSRGCKARDQVLVVLCHFPALALTCDRRTANAF